MRKWLILFMALLLAALPAWAESVEWKVVYSNELTNADGTGNAKSMARPER